MEADYKKKMNDLQKNLNFVREENENLHDENTQLKEKLRSTDSYRPLERRHPSRGGADNQLQDLSRELQLSQKCVEMRDYKIKELNYQIETLSSQIQDLQDKNDKLSQRASFLEKQLSSKGGDDSGLSRGSESRLQMRISQLTQENTKLKKDLEVVQDIANALQGDDTVLHHAMEENEELKKQVKELTDIVNNSKKSGEGLNSDEVNDLKKAVKELRKNLIKTEEALEMAKVNIIY